MPDHAGDFLKLALALRAPPAALATSNADVAGALSGMAGPWLNQGRIPRERSASTRRTSPVTSADSNASSAISSCTTPPRRTRSPGSPSTARPSRTPSPLALHRPLTWPAPRSPGCQAAAHAGKSPAFRAWVDAGSPESSRATVRCRARASGACSLGATRCRVFGSGSRTTTMPATMVAQPLWRRAALKHVLDVVGWATAKSSEDVGHLRHRKVPDVRRYRMVELNGVLSWADLDVETLASEVTICDVKSRTSSVSCSAWAARCSSSGTRAASACASASWASSAALCSGRDVLLRHGSLSLLTRIRTGRAGVRYGQSVGLQGLRGVTVLGQRDVALAVDMVTPTLRFVVAGRNLLAIVAVVGVHQLHDVVDRARLAALGEISVGFGDYERRGPGSALLKDTTDQGDDEDQRTD